MHGLKGLVVPLAVLALACGREQPPTAVEAELEGRATVQHGLPGSARAATTYDDLLYAVSSNLPGFGGFFPDSSGGLVVWLTDPGAQEELARQAILSVTEEAKRVRETTFAIHGSRPLSFRKAAYRFEDLYSWKRMLYATGLPEGTVYVGIGKRSNRLEVGVHSDKARLGWQAKIGSVGVPLAAVRFEILPPVPLIADYLRLKVRPTMGGIQLDGPNQCSLGTNVQYRLDPLNRHFLTASHCSKNQWAIDLPGFHEWFQIAPDDTLGLTEVADPPPFTGGACPAGMSCRYTDATVVRHTDPAAWLFGTVVRAASPSPFQIIETLSLVEQPFYLWAWPTIYKTGRTTGTTTNPDVLGTDTDYCYDWPIGNDRVVLCQFRFPEGFTVSGGDSGAPVFGIYQGLQPYGTAYLVGLAVGGGLGHRTIVTPAGNLSWDFGYDVNGGYVQYYTCIGIGFCF